MEISTMSSKLPLELLKKKFIYRGNVSHVAIVGSFDDWVGRFPLSWVDGEWIRKILVYPGFCEFKFKIGEHYDHWVCDETQPIVGGNNQIFVEGSPSDFGENNQILMEASPSEFGENNQILMERSPFDVPKLIDKPTDVYNEKPQNHTDTPQQPPDIFIQSPSFPILNHQLLSIKYTDHIGESLAKSASDFLLSCGNGSLHESANGNGVAVLISSLITERVLEYFPSNLDPRKILPVGVQRVGPGQKGNIVPDPYGNLVVLNVTGNHFSFVKGENFFLEKLYDLQSQ